MSDQNPYEAPGDQSPTPEDGGETMLGHPKGLFVLFGAEMFERVCYYGMRGLLVLYLTKAIMMGDDAAFGVYGAYTALVYAAPVAGGKLADMVIGYRRAVIFGGAMMAIGEFMILGGNEFWMFAGMGAIIVGNGFFKANISTIVGRLYEDGDPKKDSGFTIFYMGINLGALLATVFVAPIGETYGFLLGFALAGVGMLCGIGIFMMGSKLLLGHGEPANPEALKKYGLFVYGGSVAAVPVLYWLVSTGATIMFLGQSILFWLLLATLVYVCGNLLVEGIKDGPVQRDRVIVLMILMVFNVTFWACFEQAGSSLTLFADRNVDRGVFGWVMPASATQSFNPFFIIVFGAVFTWMWVKLAKIGKNPNIPVKFGLGIIQLGAGYLLLLFGASLAGEDYQVPLFILGFTYLLHTTGELFLSPIGLSMVTKLAPKRMTGAVMGAWFLSFAFSNYLAAEIAKLTGAGEDASGEAIVQTASESLASYSEVYGQMGWITVGIGAFLVVLAKPLNKMMHGVK